jgi:DNA-binding SARP family transcriptional activator
VREFLEARLRSTAGADAVTGLHLGVAKAAAGTDWRTAAYHYREAGDLSALASVVAGAIPEIMGSGQYAVAAGFVEQVPPELRSAALNLVRSRVVMQRGDRDSAVALSSAVLVDAEPGSQESDHALLNLATMYMHAGDIATATAHLDRLRSTSRSEDLRLIAEGMAMMIAASGSGELEGLTRHLQTLAERQRGAHQHYFGVTMLNLAIITILRDDPSAAIDYTASAIEALEETSSQIELSTAIMTRATALMMLGRIDEAERVSDQASAYAQSEAALERADMMDSYGDPEATWALLDRLDGNTDLNRNDRMSLSLQVSRYLLRRARYEEAATRLADLPSDASGTFVGRMVAGLGTSAYLAVAAGSPEGPDLATKASQAARVQGAEQWRRIAELLRAFCGSAEEFTATIRWVGASSPWNVTFVADLVARRLDELDASAMSVVTTSARLHPGRWRFALRTQVTASSGTQLNAARLLEVVGERSDIKRLRSFARRHRRTPGASGLGKALARRLADRVYVEDQNRVTIRVGNRQITGSTIRRKVLALLSFLLTKPEMAATRDQVLDALWPDLDPIDAVNSLNQTVYFLRRILEEEYVDDLSPGYLHHDSDLIWFDQELVTSRTSECRRLLRSLPAQPSPEQVDELVALYSGRFALDFEYEEWATPYRDWLHASFLEVVERSLMSDIESGHFERGVGVARRVLDVDPTAEQVEVSLVRLYRASGAHAAAAEQYGHYAATMRDQLGIEPPPLDSL